MKREGKSFRRLLLGVVICSLLLISESANAQVVFKENRDDSKLNLTLSNQKIVYTLALEGDKLLSTKLMTQKSWAKEFGSSSTEFETDGNFAFNIMYADWRAPGKQNNADNPVLLDKKFFQYQKYETKEIDGGAKELIIFFKGIETSINAILTIKLAPNDFYARQKIAVVDSSNIGHMLRFIFPVYAATETSFDLLKKGDFGQPVAITTGDGGLFFGIEYPGSTNLLKKNSSDQNVIECGQEIGEIISAKPIESDWCVIGISPDEYVKKWFMKYVDDIRVQILEPFTLYNSWYDLRSAEYPKVPKENIMNEENCLRIIGLIRKNMIEKNDIKIDAFVLDDGWDVYKSDWVVRDKQFPRGFMPLVSELKKTNTTLGLWFGPTGGYSFRTDRINWMREHGYETVGKEKNYEMLCLAGKKYSALFEKRVDDFVKNYNVGFYKWDGIQFSCNEPNHGHPIDIYSRRAVIESLIEKVESVRALNPNIYLNITSGTWLSPWWVKYSNQIWMDGGDYGYADVPSISPRDAAITYRDMVLYEDFKDKDLWFPVANLMTHGIIKGKLQMLGGEDEPIEKFTDECVNYFGRGVSMWELYISPDIMNEQEWNAVSKSIHWARDRFSLLKNSFMIGGDPKKGEPYGYVHFDGAKGIIDLRNPVVTANDIKVKLDPSLGFSSEADSLVVEKVYPSRWIFPKLFSSGDKIDFQLDGFESAVYEIYPLKNATEPLIGGVAFTQNILNGKKETIDVFRNDDAVLLNPGLIDSLVVADSTYQLKDFAVPEIIQNKDLVSKSVDVSSGDKNVLLTADITIDSSMTNSKISILFKPSEDYADKSLPIAKFFLHDKEVLPKHNGEKGKWDWYSVDASSGDNHLKIEITPDEGIKEWKGKASLWLIADQKQKSVAVKIISKENLTQRILPPLPRDVRELQKTVFIDDETIKISD